MEVVNIIKNNTNIDLFIYQNSLIELKIDNPFSKALDFLKYFQLSTNKVFLGTNDNYDVYLDKNSNLKHYVKDGYDNLELLFLNNGWDACYYKGEKLNKNQKKIFKIKDFIIVCSLAALLLIGNSFSTSFKYNSYSLMDIPDYTATDIYDLINVSSNLQEVEKKFLCNEEFLNDILPFINSSNYTKYKYLQHFNNLIINSYEFSDNTDGYYTLSDPNALYIKNYDGNTLNYENTISHEFVHLCQDITGYNLIIEASAEIISHEYFNKNKTAYYYYQVKLLKELMEVIGADAIWYYNFTGDFSQIEERVKPYLSTLEYQDFLDSLTFSYKTPNNNLEKFKRLKELIGILYQNIYNENIENDLIINLIERNEFSLVRYYFNPRYINEEHSYYYDKQNGEYQTISLEEALKKEFVNVYSIKETELKYEEIKNFINNNNLGIKREIDYSSNKIIITRRTDGNNKTYISGFIDNIKYDNVNIDELYEQGLINIKYYLVKVNKLSYQEYINQEYDFDAEIIISHVNDTIINGNEVFVFVPSKAYLPTINERYEKNKPIL